MLTPEEREALAYAMSFVWAEEGAAGRRFKLLTSLRDRLDAAEPVADLTWNDVGMEIAPISRGVWDGDETISFKSEPLLRFINRKRREAALPTVPPAPAAPRVPDGAAVKDALYRAWGLGQRYWQQADSEFSSEHRKAGDTEDQFKELVAQTLNALAAAPRNEQSPCACWPGRMCDRAAVCADEVRARNEQGGE